MKRIISMFLLGLILLSTVTAIPSFAHSNTIDKEIFYINEEGNKVIVDEKDLEVGPMSFPCCYEYRADRLRDVTLYQHSLVPGQRNFCEIGKQSTKQCMACGYISISDYAWGHDGYHDIVNQPGYKNCPF